MRMHFKMKAIIIGLLLVSCKSFAGCTLEWDYDFDAAEWIEGFRMYQSDAAVGIIEPQLRSSPCDALGLVPGLGPLTITAYRGETESEQSLPAVFDLSAPGLRVIISMP